MTKANFLRECMNDPALVSGTVPHNEFMANICKRCGNQECEISRANQLSFTDRVTNWKKNLFLEVPRADDNDPAYEAFRQKQFTSVNSVQPKTVVSLPIFNPVITDAPPQRFAPFRQEPQVIPADVMKPPTHGEPSPTTEPVTETDLKFSIEPTQEKPTISKPTPENTPFEQGKVLPGGPKSETVVEVGGTFTFSDDE